MLNLEQFLGLKWVMLKEADLKKQIKGFSIGLISMRKKSSKVSALSA